MKKKINPIMLYSILNKGLDIVNKPIQTYLGSIIMSKCAYTIDMSSLIWMLDQQVFMKYLSHIPRRQNISYSTKNCGLMMSYCYYDNPTNKYGTSYPKRRVVMEDMKDQLKRRPNAVHDNDDILDEALTINPGTYYDVYMFRKTPIICKYEVKAQDRGGVDKYMSLSTLRTEYDMKNIRAFIGMLRRESMQVQDACASHCWTILEDRNDWFLREDRPKRSFDDVFIPHEQQELLVSSVKKFIASREWYERNHIPYHFGVMLHGEPGTGKSSIVQALINEVPCDVIYVPAGNLMALLQTGSHIFGDPLDTRRTKMLIVEDIDTNNFTKSREKTIGVTTSNTDHGLMIENSATNLGKLLNFIDGMISPKNVIWVFTTNHIDELDPALIRPGRIDIKLEISYVIEETMDRFLKAHFGKGLPWGRCMKEKVSFAQLQTEVMREKTYDEIVDQYTEPRIID